MQTTYDLKAMDSLIAALSDRRVDYNEVIKAISIQPRVSQEIVFEFVLEYISHYAFIQASGSFVNANMDIAKTMSDIKYTLDEITSL